MISRSLASIAALAALLASSPLANADEMPTVGVAVAAAINLTPDDALGIATSLADAIERRLVVDASAGRDLQDSLPEQARSADCLGDPACLAEAARAAGVDQLVMLVIVRVGDELKVEPTWFDVASGQTAQRTAIDVGGAQSMDASFEQAAALLLPQAERRAEVSAAEPPSELVTTPEPIEVREPAGRRMTTASWTLLGAGGVLLVGGFGAATVTYLGKPDDDAADYQDWADTQESLNLVADIAGGLGVAAIATSAILYWRSGGDEDGPALSVDSRDGGFALSLGGQF